MGFMYIKLMGKIINICLDFLIFISQMFRFIVDAMGVEYYLLTEMRLFHSTFPTLEIGNFSNAR